MFEKRIRKGAKNTGSIVLIPPPTDFVRHFTRHYLPEGLSAGNPAPGNDAALQQIGENNMEVLG